MVIRNFAKLALAALAAAACSVQEPTQEVQAPKSSEPVLSDGFIPGVVTVEFDEAMTAFVEEDMAAACEEIGAISMERVFPDAGEFEPRHRREGLHRFYYVNFNKNLPVTKAAASFKDVPGVVSATPERPVRLRAVFNDPILKDQWHMVNTSTPSADIHVQEVWQQYTVGDDRVIVAIMDEPVQYNHEDLAANMWDDGSGNHGYNQFSDNYTLYYDKSESHGTHVAGVVAAVNNNNTGVCGIAGGDALNGVPGVRLMSIPVFPSTSQEERAAKRDTKGQLTLNGYVWAADHGAVISQNSWGYSADANEDGEITAEELADFKTWTIDDIPSLHTAIDYFIKNAGCDKDTDEQLPDSPMKGGLVFFAAGNDGDQNVDFDPICAYEPVISVGSFRKNGTASSFSNYGSWVDIAAPGGEGIYNSFTGKLTVSEPIWSTVVDNKYSGEYTVVEYGETYQVPWMGTSMACPHASGVAALIVSYFGGPGFTADDARDILLGGLGATIGGSKPVGKKLDALASFQWAIQNNYRPGGVVDPSAPVITFSKKRLTLKAYQTDVVKVTGSDPDGDSFDLVCESTGSDAAVYDQASGNLLITARNAPAGSYKAVFRITDSSSKSTTATVSYTILENNVPTAQVKVDDIAQYGKAGIVISNPVEEMFQDLDGEDLTFTVSAENSAVLSVAIKDGKLAMTPKMFGLTTVTITATDTLGAAATISFKVAIINRENPVTVDSQAVTGTVEFNIDAKESTPVYVTIFNSAGTVVQEYVASASVFYPVQVDVSKLAPGRYTALLEYNGQSRTVKFAKY